MLRNAFLLKDKIITKLSFGSRNVGFLVNEISRDEHVTAQGVYKALRTLRTEEIVLIHNKSASLSLIWISNERERLRAIERSYIAEGYVENLQKKHRGKVSFVFTSLKGLDLFWTHSYSLISENIDAVNISYSIQPHDWYYYARLGTDAYWAQKHRDARRPSRFTITHATRTDKQVMQKRNTEKKLAFESFYGNPLKQDEHTYFNIIGDYVYKITLDRRISGKLNTFIAKQTGLAFSEEGWGVLSEILTEKGRHKMVIQKSKIIADKIRKKVDRYF